MKSRPLLFEILEKLEKPEVRQFKKYIRSPFVTHRTDLSLLFNTLAFYLYEEKPFPQKEELFKIVFPNREFDDQTMRNAMSDLFKLLEEYFIWRSSQQDKIGSNLALAALYQQRNLPKHFQRTISKVKKINSNQVFRNVDYYQNLLNYQSEIAQSQTNNLRTGGLNLQEIDDTTDVLYLAKKLRHACTQLSHRAVYQTDYQFGLLKEYIDSIENSHYLKIPAIALYFYCYRFLTEEYSQVYFRKFRNELIQNESHFPKEELKDLYRAAINFCIRKLNEGSLEFTREGWELFQDGLEHDIFMENNQLSRFTFDNMVGFGLRLKEYEAVAVFIEKYKSTLDPIYKKNTVYFNLARLEYKRENYNQALQYLQAADAKDLVVQLISKTLTLKIYFEAGEFDLLDSHLDSFRQFIRRREVSDYHRVNYQNIIRFTRKLITLQPYNKQEKERLKSAIESEKVLTEKKWLIEKIG